MSFIGTTYPVEQSFSPTVSGYIAKIRSLIGDNKGIKRDYIDSCYNDVMGDYYVYILEEKSWPLRVTITTSAGVSTEFTTLSNPVVQDYQYVVFSGAQNQITPGTTLDLWLETFQFSNKEIYDVYSTVDVPGVPTADETIEMVLTAAALELAESEFNEFSVQAATRISDGDTLYDPTPAIQARQAGIKRLVDRLEDLTKHLGRTDGSRVE